MKKNYRKILGYFILTVMSVLCTNVTAQTIDTQGKTQHFEHYWDFGVGAGRHNEGLRASWQEHLQLAKKNCGFRYVRMHGLFHDDMFIYNEKPNGKVVYNWQYLDDVYDRMLSLGVRPFVELAFFPKDIARKDSKTEFWWKANISVDPNNFCKWHDLVKAFVQHCVDRYGLDEIKKWYFEVWNEPNLYNIFLDGTKSDYFRLYKEAVTAVKSVDSSLRVGGPATCNFTVDSRFDGETMDNTKSVFFPQDQINKQQWKNQWVIDFLNYCKQEKLPVDFVSAHPYPTDYALDPDGHGRNAVRYVHSLRDDISWLRKQIASSAYPNVELHLTEWSSSPSARDAMHDYLPPAAYIMKAYLECVGMANSLMYWAFTDVFEEKGAGENIFHGGFGMINYQGIVKPTFHAFRMMNQLGDEMIYNTDPLCVTRSSKTRKVTAVAYNYPQEYEQFVPATANMKDLSYGTSKTLDLKLKGFKPHAKVLVEVMDKDNGNVYSDYLKMGSPHSPNKLQTEQLKKAAWNTKKINVSVGADGVLCFRYNMPPWCCMLIKEL